MSNFRETLIPVTTRPLIILSLVFLVCICVFLGMYFIKHEQVLTDDNSLTMSPITYAPKHLECYFTPNKNTIPNKLYKVALDNGIWHWTFKVKWSELEYNIQKNKVSSIKISNDEYVAYVQGNVKSKSVYFIQLQHNPKWIVASYLLLSAQYYHHFIKDKLIVEMKPIMITN